MHLFNNIRGLLLVLLLVFCLKSTYTQQIDNLHNRKDSNDDFFDIGYAISRQNPDSAYLYFHKGLKLLKQNKDTSFYINCIIGISDIEKHRGQYNDAFEWLWKALDLSQKSSDTLSLIKIHTKIGVLYNFYGKNDVAISQLKKSLYLNKSIASKTYAQKPSLTSSHFSIAEYYIQMKEYDVALMYLDSCYKYNPTKNRLFYIDANYAHIYTVKKDYTKAEKFLKQVLPYFIDNSIGYQAIVYSYKAELKEAFGDKDSAIYFYEKSLDAIDNMHVHLEEKPEILSKLSLLYRDVGKYKSAFTYMQAAKNVSDTLFHAQSEHNKKLFEIKNGYKESLDHKERELEHQSKILQQKDIAQFRLKLLIGFIILLGLVIYVSFRLRSKMKRIVLEQKLKEEKNKALFEVQNKELASNALQMIEKEQIVEELLEALKINDPVSYVSLNQKYSYGNKKLWADFQKRFNQINNTFYEKLRAKHSGFTPKDLNHCALIKLNFDSKEMAQILGISVHAVHTSRSRIRKKIGMKRGDNLGEYITNL